ncbi:hypothetical protein Baya_9649 [Bagarius yarrelli]|uniref:Uncharacterized protein n=1 Tax=Bagarius yarrelli TaxID=175774 RepID=A0A556UY71_BAGYA|nr:hypothetical protein Baya_9649 [Bagarius yarrelli]
MNYETLKATICMGKSEKSNSPQFSHVQRTVSFCFTFDSMHRDTMHRVPFVDEIEMTLRLKLKENRQSHKCRSEAFGLQVIN